MKRNNIFLAGVFALSLFVTGTAVSYGATDQEVCRESKKNFDAMVRNNGLLPGDEFNPYNYKEVANAATAMLANEKNVLLEIKTGPPLSDWYRFTLRISKKQQRLQMMGLLSLQVTL